jgi:hypothetical protein
VGERGCATEDLSCEFCHLDVQVGWKMLSATDSGKSLSVDGGGFIATSGPDHAYLMTNSSEHCLYVNSFHCSKIHMRQLFLDFWCLGNFSSILYHSVCLRRDQKRLQRIQSRACSAESMPTFRLSRFRMVSTRSSTPSALSLSRRSLYDFGGSVLRSFRREVSNRFPLYAYAVIR